ncbi:MAG: hypothetical protein CO189_08335 [candidate division Zixibacteria bacterium CG_4_9_14_3_um_filter_46_8]|nr:MAG: hypothetical protein CO189_08335 [candidate division Zixibacteria bacterium CG_4_9_14_3_um_filter_46_8]
MKKISIIAIVALMCWGANVAAEQTSSPFHHDIYALGMGDAFVAHGSNANAFLYNPALLARVEKFQLSVLDLQLSVNKSFMDVVNYMNDNQDKFENWDSLSPAERTALYNGMQDFDDRWVVAGAYPSFNVVLPAGLGFAVYDNVAMKVRLDRGIYEPRGYADLNNDLVFAVGYARDINPKLSLGSNFKYISRRISGPIRLKALDFGNAEDTYKDVEDSLADTKSGYGFDVGALYSLQPNLDLGASIIDLLGSVDGDKTPINFRVGAAYHYTGRITGSFLREIIFAGDLDDMFNRDGDHLFNKTHLGADFLMPVVSLRLGLNQGYPSFGAGINLKVARFEYAYIGRELGNAPGRESDYSHYAQLRLGWM